MDAVLTNVVEAALLARMQAKESFTALDISNALKADRFPMRHREVAEAVREVYESGAMDCLDYRRQLIPVVTEGGAKTAQAYVYYHASARSGDYATRTQEALPPVPPDRARDLSDCVAAGALGALPRPVCPPSVRRSRQGSGVSCPPGCRRDGALPVPRRLIEQLGWTEGSALSVEAESGRLTVRPDAADSGTRVRVWGGQRVRVCKTKLRLGALSAERVTLEVEGDSLRIRLKESDEA